MAPRVTLTVRNETGERGSLETWGEALRNPVSALEAIGARLERDVEQRFATKTNAYGEKWAPLSPTTIALHGDGTEALAAKRFHEVDAKKKRVNVGVRSAAGRTRQYGAPRNRMYGGPAAPVPARGVLPLKGRRVVLPPAISRDIMRLIGESLRKSAKGGG